MVGWSIQNQTVRITQLHTGNHTTHLLTSGKHIHFLQYFLSGKQHTPQETFHIDFVTFAKLTQPIYQIQITFKEIRIIQRQISRSNSNAPREFTSLRSTISIDYFKKSSHGTRITAQKDNLISFFYIKIHIIEQYHTVFSFRTQAGYFQNLIARFTIRSKDDTGIFTGRRLNFIYIQFFQHLLSAGCLLALSHIGTKTTDKFFQLFLLLFSFSLLVLLLAKCQLT